MKQYLEGFFRALFTNWLIRFQDDNRINSVVPTSKSRQCFQWIRQMGWDFPSLTSSFLNDDRREMSINACVRHETLTHVQILPLLDCLGNGLLQLFRCYASVSILTANINSTLLSLVLRTRFPHQWYPDLLAASHSVFIFRTSSSDRLRVISFLYANVNNRGINTPSLLH